MCEKCKFETSENEKMKEHNREKHRIFECEHCDKKSSSEVGLMMHSKKSHAKQVVDMNIEESTGKRKCDSIVNRLTSRPNGNKITTTAGFMVVQNDGEAVDEDTSENAIKPKKRKLSERLQAPITVKKEHRSAQVNVNSFRTQTLTMKKKASRMQREAGTEPDYVILMRNNLQSDKTSNASASAGKYYVFGEGAIKDKLLEGGIQFDAKKMFLMANNYNFEEEKITTEGPLTEKLLKIDVKEKRTASEKNDNFKPRKVATPGFGAPLSSNSSQESSSDDSSD